MTRFLSLHEAKIPTDDLSQKYDVPTYADYKAWAHTEGRIQHKAFLAGETSRLVPFSQPDWTPRQRLAFSLICTLAITGGEKPRYIVINADLALSFATVNDKVPLEFEGIPLVFDRHGLPSISFIL